MELSKLSRKHGFKIAPGFPCSVEECSLAVGELVGYSSIKSAARMNGAVVIFVDDVNKANKVVEAGIVVNDTFLTVSPLSTPANRVTIANIPPFIPDEVLITQLSRHGKIVSPIRKLPSGCKSPLLKHVVSHRRQVYMILNKKDEELNLVLNLKVDEFDYVIFVNSGSLKCFGCGGEGHLVRACPERLSSAGRVQSNAGHAQSEAVRVSAETTGTQQNSDKRDRTETSTQNEKSDRNTVREENQAADRVVLNSDGGDGGGDDEDDDNDDDVDDDNDDNDDLMEEEQVGRLPVLKRKQTVVLGGSQAKRGVVTRRSDRQQEEQVSELNVEVEEEEGEEEECAADSQTVTISQPSVALQHDKHYELRQVKDFLQQTKNMKKVKVEEHFADKELFLHSVRAHMSREKGGYTDQETYRLKKILQRIKQELQHEESETV